MSIGRMLETKAPDLDEMSSRENRRTVLPARHFFEPEDDCDVKASEFHHQVQLAIAQPLLGLRHSL
jgi:hypothetical protein